MTTIDRAALFADLAKPMPYKWRLKQVANKAKKPYPPGARGQFMAYIDARDVFNRLDAVVGGDQWQDSVKRVNEDGSVIVALSLCINGEWLTKEDIGYPNNPGAGVEDEPLKAAVSDGIKRAAVHYGVGRFLYDLPATWTEVDQHGQPTRPLPGETAPAQAPIQRAPSPPQDQRAPAPAPTPITSARSAPANQAANRPAPASHEASGPAQSAEEDQACAIDGCPGVCTGSWVGFSIRRYGVPLCSKHSAMAKRGEIDDQLGQLNAAPAR